MKLPQYVVAWRRADGELVTVYQHAVCAEDAVAQTRRFLEGVERAGFPRVDPVTVEAWLDTSLLEEETN